MNLERVALGVSASGGPAGPGRLKPGLQTAGSLETWFTPFRFACVLALLIVAAFPDVVLGAGTFYLRDFGIFTYPLAHYQRESFWRGEIPLWNPLSSCGVPFLAQWGTLAAYPPALFYLVLPLSWSLGMFCLLHLFLAGFGMYRLAGRWTGNRFAAALAGVAFAFNGAMLCCLAWVSTIVGLGWMPWVVLCMDSLKVRGSDGCGSEVEDPLTPALSPAAGERGNVDQRGEVCGSQAQCTARRHVVVAALIGALQMLSGAPEVILFTWLVVGVMWVGRNWRIEDGGWRMAGQELRRLALVVLLVTGLAAAQLLPFFDLLAHSQRGSGFGDSAWAMPVWGWANFLVPLFHCFRSHQGVFVQSGQYWLASYYLGIGVVALVLLAAKARRRRVVLLALALLLSLVLALGDGGGLYRWLREVVPPISFMRYPIKFVLLAMFLAPLLAAFAVNWYLALPVERTQGARRQIGSIAVILGLLIAVVLLVARRYPLPTDQWTATWQCGLGRVVVLVLFVGVFAALPRVPGKSQWLCGLALLVVLWLDVMAHAPRLNPTISRGVYEPGWARAQLKLDPEPRPGGSRVLPSPAARAMLFKLNLPDPVDDYLFSRLGFLGDCNLLDDMPKVESFYPLYPREVETLRALLYATTNTDLPRLADFLGVSHITAPGKMIDWQPRRSFLPLITGGQKPVFADDATTLRALASPAFDAREVVYLPTETRASITAGKGATVKIQPAEFASHRVEFTVEAAAPSLVVVAQTYYHLWQAALDGRRVPLWRANYGFQALEVPRGVHRVGLVYRDPWFLTGTVLSAATLIGCLVGLRPRPASAACRGTPPLHQVAPPGFGGR